MPTILYHGTSDANSKSILVNGIIPNHKNNWDAVYQQKSLNGLVYLTNNDKKAEYYAIRSAIKNKEDALSLIEVEVVEDQLYPDENLFVENYFPSKSDVLSAQEKVLKNKDLWEKSLKEKELVAVSGIIDVKYIKNIKTISLNDSSFYTFIKNCKEKTLEKFDEIIHMYSVVLNSGWFFTNFGNEFIDFSKLEIWEEYDYHILSYKNKEVKIT